MSRTGGLDRLEAARQRSIDVLCDAFADDAITVDEFERRVEEAHGATDFVVLKELLSDLPARTISSDSPMSPAPTGPKPQTGADAPSLPAARRGHELPPMAAPAEVPERSHIMGILGGGGRKGRWIPARSTVAVAVMGGVELDLRDAIFPPGVSEIRAIALCGGVDVLVPPNVRVEVSGIGLLGGFEQRSTVAPTDNPAAPVVRVSGIACMGGVDVKVRYPGETNRDARRRLRFEKKARKRLGRGQS